MSIATAINDLSSRIQNVYDICETKGADIPFDKTTYNLSSTVDSLVTEKYNVTLNDVFGKTENGRLVKNSDEIIDLNFAGISAIDADLILPDINKDISSVHMDDLKELYIKNFMTKYIDKQPNITTISFKNLNVISALCAFYGLFYKTIGLLATNAISSISVNFDNLETINASDTFNSFLYNAKNVNDFSFETTFPKLKRINATQTFNSFQYQGVSNIISVCLPALETMSGSKNFYTAFYNNTIINKLDLPILSSIDGTSNFYEFIKNGNVVPSMSVNLSALKYIHGNQNFNLFCRSATRFYGNFDSLEEISGNQNFYTTNAGNSYVYTKFPKLKRVIGNENFYQAFFNTSTIGYNDMFVFPELEELSGNSNFYGVCRYVYANVRFEFPKLKRVIGNQNFSLTLRNATLTTFNFDSLEEISGNGAFSSVGSVPPEIAFPSLKKIQSTGTLGIFNNLTTLRKIYLPKLEEALGTAYFNGCTNLTEIHFPASSQTAIESSAGYATLWGRGAGNATVYFDL